MTFRQMLIGLSNTLKKGQAEFNQKGVSADRLVEKTLHPTMLCLDFQIQSAIHHALAGTLAIGTGTFRPMSKTLSLTYDGHVNAVQETIDSLEKLTLERYSKTANPRISVELPKATLRFTLEDFLLSFSIPNFFFHVTTAYDILRANEVSIGKSDYLGPMRISM